MASDTLECAVVSINSGGGRVSNNSVDCDEISKRIEVSMNVLTSEKCELKTEEEKSTANRNGVSSSCCTQIRQSYSSSKTDIVRNLWNSGHSDRLKKDYSHKKHKGTC